MAKAIILLVGGFFSTFWEAGAERPELFTALADQVFKTIGYCGYWHYSSQNDPVIQTIVEVIYSPERTAQVQIFRRTNGTFGFPEERFLAEEKSWVPFGRYSEAVVDNADLAIREATGRVSWLADALKPRAYSLSWIRSLSGDPDATFISTNTLIHAAVATAHAHPGSLGERLRPKQILQVGGLYCKHTGPKRGREGK